MRTVLNTKAGEERTSKRQPQPSQDNILSVWRIKAKRYVGHEIKASQWYWKDMKETIKILKRVLAGDWSKHRLFYHSSW